MITETQREELIEAVQAADLACPEQVCDMVEAAGDRDGYDAAVKVLAAAKANDAAETITIKADDENNAETFWAGFDETYPAIAEQVRGGEATIDAATWKAIQELEGFSDGPYYAREALVEA